MSSTQGKVVINDLRVMEDIVDKRSDLVWNGWDIVQLFRDDDAMTNKKGIFYKNSWYRTRNFDLDTNGWEIPKSWVA